MKKKIIGIVFSMLLCSGIGPLSGTVLAGSESHPEIEDTAGDAFGYLDVHAVWFFEDPAAPDHLFVSMQINQPRLYVFQQTFAVFWKHEGTQYSCGLHLGFLPGAWERYSAGTYDTSVPGGKHNLTTIEDGSYDASTGVITWKIPRELIGNPEEDDVLTDTWSNAFRRLGLIGRVGITRHILDALILMLLGNHLWDHAPDELGDYGDDYTIQL